jgi:poly(3-hydroxybutyrate) depolymerase
MSQRRRGGIWGAYPPLSPAAAAGYNRSHDCGFDRVTASTETAEGAAVGLATRIVTAWLDVTSHAVAVGAQYWQDAIARSASAADVLDDAATWMRLTQNRREPTWGSPSTVLTESRVARLRDFSPEGASARRPTLILPPQAGHHSCIVDFSPRQSQVGVAVAAGLDRLFVLEWLEATPDTADASIDEYVASVRDAVEHIGAPVHLIGDCQGGWLAGIYAALEPDSVATLTVGAAPIDFHSGEGPLIDYVALMSSLHASPYEAMVDAGGGLLRGEAMLAGFIALAPEEEAKKHLDLLLEMHDPEFVRRYAEFENWFKYTQDIAGAFYLWIVEHLFEGNELVAGTLEIGGRPVDLGTITCPVTILAGSRDHITPPEQAFALAQHVATVPEAIRCELVDAGHLGLFMSRSALREHWAPLLAELARGE